MHAHRGVYVRVLHESCGDHLLSASEDLFARLEHELDRALQLVLMLFEQLRRSEQHRRVQIVSAAVTIAVCRSEGQPGLLGHRQRVHVASDQQHFAAVADGRRHARLAAQLRLIAVAL